MHPMFSGGVGDDVDCVSGATPRCDAVVRVRVRAVLAVDKLMM